MKVAILSSGRGWHSDDLVRALMDRGHDTRVVCIPTLEARVGYADAPVAGGSGISMDGVALEEMDAVILRTIPLGSLEQIIFRVDALHRLERLGVPVVNPARVVERTVDKFFTSTLLEEAGLPTPRTVVAERVDQAMAAFAEMGDVVVKPLFGSNGRGIVRIDDEELAYRVFRALEMERAVFYVQETVPHQGRDVRAFVVGGRVVSAIWRNSDTWRTNLSRGGYAERAALPHAWADMALAAVHAVGAEYAGVDLIPSTSGEVYVIEVNGSPGWRGLQPVSDVDIADAIVAHVETIVRRIPRRPSG